MWPDKETYYNSMKNAQYIQFNESHRSQKKYIDLSVGFYGGCSYHPSAWDKTFESLREHFPSAPVVIFQDGFSSGHDYSAMASKYSATYLVENTGIYLYWPTPEQAWKYLQWILKAADVCNTEWLIQLHPDNIFNDKFHIPPPGPLCGLGCGSRNGISNNKLHPSLRNYVYEKYPNIEDNGYGWAGGGCLHVPTFRKIMETFTFDDVKTLYSNVLIKESDNNVSNNDDFFIPFIFNIYGYPYRVWLEIEEPGGAVGESAAIQHRNKTYYYQQKTGTRDEILKDILQDLNKL